MHNAELLRCTRLRFHFTANTSFHLAPYKGSVFHGAFGLALKSTAPALYGELFGDTSANGKSDIPKPFVLRSPSDKLHTYSAGSSLQCELLLIGYAVNHLSVCICAMDHLGRQGLGKARGKLSLSQVDAVSPDQSLSPIYRAAEQRWQPPPPVITGADIIAAHNTHPPQTITLAFQSYVRLKHNNQLVHRPPPFQLLFSRILGRLSMLAWLFHDVVLLDDAAKHDFLEQAGNIDISASTLHWQDWIRYSGRQQKLMKFGGLLGEISYRGDLAPFMPYLALGEWLHVGGKTSFGLGQYQIKD